MCSNTPAKEGAPLAPERVRVKFLFGAEQSSTGLGRAGSQALLLHKQLGFPHSPQSTHRKAAP